MHRRGLLTLLDRYERHFVNEAHVVQRIRSLVESRADCFERSCRPGHITASTWIVSHSGDRCLLTHHRKLNLWVQLGGHTDGEHDVLAAALREAREESGLRDLQPRFWSDEVLPLDLDVHVIPPLCDANGQLLEDEHEHHDIRFLLVADPQQTLEMSDESHDLRWFDSSEVRQVTSEQSVLRMQRKAVEWVSR